MSARIICKVRQAILEASCPHPVRWGVVASHRRRLTLVNPHRSRSCCSDYRLAIATMCSHPMQVMVQSREQADSNRVSDSPSTTASVPSLSETPIVRAVEHLFQKVRHLAQNAHYYHAVVDCLEFESFLVPIFHESSPRDHVRPRPCGKGRLAPGRLQARAFVQCWT